MIRQTWTVSPETGSLRVDAFLRVLLPDLPESVLRRVFSDRDVKVNGRRVSRDQLLFPGDSVTVFLPDSVSAGALDIVYEDADVLLVNKRAGLSVEADSGGGVTLTELCRQHTAAEGIAEGFPAPCHRLDHQTCGLCLFAKTPEALQVLLEVFRERTLDKRYECLVRGIPKPPSATCRAYLVKDAEQARVRITDQPAHGAKRIVTAYETLQSGTVSRLSVHLITGRTHQIRAHLAALGHPILGDDLYGDRALNRELKTRSLKLCAVSLALDTRGKLPQLDGRRFSVAPPF